jgi:hypothetical protein
VAPPRPTGLTYQGQIHHRPPDCLVLRGPSARRRDGIVGWLGLWFLRGLRRSNSFTVSNLMLQEWGIQPDAKTRTLRALEKAGLIRVERRGKRSPLVTLIVGNRFNGGTVAAPSGKPVGGCSRNMPKTHQWTP